MARGKGEENRDTHRETTPFFPEIQAVPTSRLLLSISDRKCW